MLNKIFRSTLLWLLLAILLQIIIYNRWFLTNEIYTWGDWGFYYKDTIKEWFMLPQIWQNAFLGGPDIGLSLYVPAKALYGFLAQFLDAVYVDRLTFIFPSVIIPAVSVFLLVKDITKNNISALIGSILYNLNTYILLMQTGHLTLATSYGLGPLVLFLFRRSLLEKSLFYAILTGLAGTIASFYEVRGFYVIAMILFLYSIFTIIFSNKNKQDSFKLTLYTSVPMIIVGILNIYWILGFLMTTSAYSGIVLDRGLVNVHSLPLYTVFTLFHPAWTGSHRLAWGELQEIRFYFWFIPFLAFMGFWLNKKNKDIIFWALIGLIGIFLTKSGGEPFPDTYQFLYDNFPGFNAFRDSSKFYYFVCLSYSVLTASFISWLWNKKYKVLLKSFITIIIACLFLVNAIPVFKGELGRLLTPRHVPQDYQVLKQFIQNQNEFFRVLYVPEGSKWGYWDSLHPKLNLMYNLRTSWKDYNNYNKEGIEYSAFDEVTDIFKNSKTNDLFDKSSIKYVIVPIEDKENEEVFIFPNNVNRTEYIDFLDRLSYLKRINIGTRELAVFENNEYSDHFSVSNGATVKTISKSPTHYELSINTLKETTLLFSESYHTDWKLRVGKFKWIDVLIQKNYFIADKYHIKDSAGLNSFNLNLKEICNNKMDDPYGCKKRSDGSFDIHISLYFKPQAYVNLGGIISLSVLIITILTAGSLYINKRRYDK